MASRGLFIFGAGGHAREVAHIVADVNAAVPIFQLQGFVVDDGFEVAGSMHGLPVHRLNSWLPIRGDCEVVVAVGSPALRRQVVRRLEHHGVDRFATLIHPRAWIGSRVQVGNGSVVFGDSSVTTDVRIGDHVHINTGCSVSHDSTLEDFATLGPGSRTCGNALVREGADLGAGCILIPHAAVGRWSIVGAGAVVTQALGDNVTAVGVPARVIKTREAGWHERTSL